MFERVFEGWLRRRRDDEAVSKAGIEGAEDIVHASCVYQLHMSEHNIHVSMMTLSTAHLIDRCTM